ncbi:MAG: D-alanine--D-alanine ligase family protein [Myxococcota bacterium]|nr:D-alanine--D-alanine ligase family protein [Myxococcota bacterium]
MAKLRVGLLFGGRSVEHEVSVASATSILRALDPSRYDVQLIAIDADGHWHLGRGDLPPELVATRGTEVAPPSAPGRRTLVEIADVVGGGEQTPELDVIFPIIHGTRGEDGTLQGMLELAEIPYVGARVLGSAVQMDKDLAKRLLAGAGLPVVPWETLRGRDLSPTERMVAARSALDRFGFPLFVKPANSGSSVGTSKPASADELDAALAEAARYDTKVLIEQAIDAREIEVAVIGNEDPRASVPGEIRQRHDFYDYAAKYADDETELLIPAPLDEATTERICALALEAYASLEGEGFARVDFLLDRTSGELYINELNSLPGFTESSMFPLMWEASGLPYPALLDRLLELALERHDQRSRLETTYRRG